MADRAHVTLPNFVSGELSPFMAGRVDLDIYGKSLQWCQNFVVIPEGGASYRAGGKMTGLTKNNAAARLIPFQFSANDAYMIVATDQKFRYYREDSVILNAAKTITGISQANPAVVTANAHGFSNGDEVYISSVEGMSEVNGRFFLVANQTTNTFELQDPFGANVNSTAYGAYASGGEASSIYELGTPYVEAELQNLRHAQTGDVMYIVARAYEPRKLERSGHTSWSIGTYARTADPFTSATKWPSVVAFSADGRACFANSQDNPEGFWGSMSPDGTTTQYDDFTAGSGDTNATIFNFAPVEGIIDEIQELRPFGRQFVLLGASSIRRVFGASPDLPPTPTAIHSQPTIEGSSKVKPIVIGSTMIFVDVSGKQLKGFQYNLGKDDYEAKNFNLVADHLGEVTFTKLVHTKGSPNAVWVLRSDGILLSFTFNDSENIAGWARHIVGGDGLVEDIATIRNSTGVDQLWMVVKRTMGGKTYRSVEVMSAWPSFPLRNRFYTGDETADEAKYRNVAWERMREAAFLDMSLTADGAARGLAKDAALTPGAVSGDSVTFTADNAVFLSSHVGRQIWKQYANDGTGGGIAQIIGYTSATQVTCKILSAFDSAAEIPAGEWEFAVTEIGGLHLFEGLTVDVQADASAHPSRTVSDGKIELQYHASNVVVGFGYLGLLLGQNIDLGTRTGPGNSLPRNIKRIRTRFKDTVGCEVGTNFYNTKELVFRQPGQIMGRVPPPFTGMKDLTMLDRWSADTKQFAIKHDSPTPCTIVAVDVDVVTTDV